MNTTPQIATRETVLQFLDANALGYQRVELPHGLATPGPDRSDTARLIFPADLAGQSVLDVGCYLGYFCHEARRRNAGRVMGLEVDAERLRQARTLAEFAGHAIEFRQFDLERDDLNERFDVVLLLNVLHHARRPIDMLNKVARYARRQLVLEVPSLMDGPMKKYLKREFGLRTRHVRWLERLPLVGVGRNGALDAQREQSFFFTPEAIRNVLLEHGRIFARVETVPSARRGRHVVVAHRRQIGTLVVLAGPSGAGKTRLWERIQTGAEERLATRLGLETPGRWVSTTALSLRALEAPVTERLILHYDLLRPQRGGARRYDRDEALDVLACADEVRVYTLVCPATVLRRRLEGRCRQETGEGLRLAEEALALYGRPGELRRIYERWSGFWRERAVVPTFIDVSADDRYELLEPERVHALVQS